MVNTYICINMLSLLKRGKNFASSFPKIRKNRWPRQEISFTIFHSHKENSVFSCHGPVFLKYPGLPFLLLTYGIFILLRMELMIAHVPPAACFDLTYSHVLLTTMLCLTSGENFGGKKKHQQVI